MDLGQVALVAGIFGAVAGVVKIFAGWLERWLGLESARQDTDRASLRKDLDDARTTFKTEISALHDRVSREADRRQSGDKELFDAVHDLEVSMLRNFQTKEDALAMEARIIDAFNRNMDARRQQNRPAPKTP